MEFKDKQSKEKEQEQTKLINLKNQIRNTKSNLILKIVFSYIHKRKSLEIIKYNKSIQKRVNININNYKEYSEKYSSIEIEIIPMKIKSYKLVYIKEEDEEYYHIFLNDNKEEIKNNSSVDLNDIVSKINIIIDYHVTSFYELFYECKYIESINFKKFYRNNINNMSDMFNYCPLKELNLSNLKLIM